MTIIFDLDGTLLNTIDDLGYACNHALERCGFATHPIGSYPAMVGNGINNLIRRALPEDERTEETILRVRKFFVSYYDIHNCDYTKPYDGITDVLKALKAQGHQLAVASNKYQAATEKIVTHFFPGMFDVILGERENIARKPDPQIVFDIVSKLSTLNAQLIYIGDSLVDRDTAKNADVPFVACSWGFVPRDLLVSSGISDIIDSPKDILGLVMPKKTIEVVAAVIFDEQGRIFATQRGYGEWKDWWEFPGGKMESGEMPEEALKREIHEELDAEIDVGELLRTIDYDYPNFHLTMHCFKCKLAGSHVKLMEHEAAKWLAPNELQSVKWLPADIEIINELRKI